MTVPRYELSEFSNTLIKQGALIFCDRVGDADVWLMMQKVIVVRRTGLRMVTDNDYSYKAAALRFPRIANKLYAMRAMHWSTTDEPPASL